MLFFMFLSFFFFLKFLLLSSGKWHQGVNCASRNDHCHHPLHHGFDYFYGMPFTLVNDCHPDRPPSLDSGLRARLWLYTQIMALGVLTIVAGKACRLISISWKLVLSVATLVLLFFTSWYASFGFVRRWNCILMRNHEVTEQPMVWKELRASCSRKLFPLLQGNGAVPLEIGGEFWVHLSLFTTGGNLPAL